MFFEDKQIGHIFTVLLNGEFARNKNGSVKTFSSEKRANTQAQSIGGRVERLKLSQSVQMQPVKVNNTQMLEGCNFLHNMIATGLAKWYKTDIHMEQQYNIIRHQELGTKKPAIKIGDQDMVVTANLLFTVDCASYDKFVNGGV